MSGEDKNTAQSMQIPIYDIDAMTGSGRVGRPANINRANPNGSVDLNVGNSIGSGSRVNQNPFNIALDALKIWGKSGKPK